MCFMELRTSYSAPENECMTSRRWRVRVNSSVHSLEQAQPAPPHLRPWTAMCLSPSTLVLLQEKLFQCLRGPSGLSKLSELAPVHKYIFLNWQKGMGSDFEIATRKNLTGRQLNILKEGSWKIWAYGELGMREGKSKHWERKYCWKAAAAAYLFKVIMVRNREVGLPLCNCTGKLEGKRGGCL